MRVLWQYILSEAGVADQKEKFRFVLMLIFVFALPYDMLYSTLALGVLLISTLIDLSREKLRLIPPQSLWFCVIYFLAILGYFYSYHKHAAGFLLERQSAILIFPIIAPMAVRINRMKSLLL